MPVGAGVASASAWATPPAPLPSLTVSEGGSSAGGVGVVGVRLVRYVSCVLFVLATSQGVGCACG